MDFCELVKKNRSYRGYDESRRIAREELMELVDCARMTPSAANKQPLKYALIWEEARVKQILPLTRWAAMLPERHLPDPGRGPAAFIVILQETEWVKDAASCQRDVGIAAQTMLLAAVEKGLGGLMIGAFDREKVSQALALPEHLVPQLLIALGKPDEKIVLTEALPGDSLRYYRDANDVHYVPKRRLEDIIL